MPHAGIAKEVARCAGFARGYLTAEEWAIVVASAQLVPHGGIAHEVGEEDGGAPVMPTEASGGSRVQVPQDVLGEEVCARRP